MTQTELLKRIDYTGDFLELLHDVCRAYDLGTYALHSFIPLGYEDLNVVLSTTNGKYLLKIFAAFRTEAECHNYIKTMRTVILEGIPHPLLCIGDKGLLYEKTHKGKTVRMCVMEYINGHNFYELKTRPTHHEQKLIIEIAAAINNIHYKPPFIYDSWAIPHLAEQFNQHKKSLTPKDLELVEPVVKQFSKLALHSLPHAFVHGDLISTNILKDRDGDLLVIDFAVATWYPRIQELAVLLCDVLFDDTSHEDCLDTYYWALDEYQKHISLTAAELKALPIYTRAAHAMHVIGASREKAHGNKEKENEHWLVQGRKGLEFTELL